MRVAIIGHGPSAAGKGYGELIDSMDFVIRMHDWEWQRSAATIADYGTKYDLGVIPSPSLPTYLQQINKTNIIPSEGWLVYVLHNQKRKKIHPKAVSGKPVYVFEHEIKRHLGDMERPPTRGLAAIVMAIEFLEPSEVFLVGFDSVLSGIVNQYPAGFKSVMEEEYIGHAKNDRHDFGVESQKVKDLALAFNIPIRDISEA